jgi:hypothetical protein
MWLLQLLVLLVVYSYQATSISWLNDAYSWNIVQMRQQSFSNNSQLLTKADDASIIDHVSEFFSISTIDLMYHIYMQTQYLIITLKTFLKILC